MLVTTREDPVIGSLLDGRYRVLSLIGRGGMGNVYLAEETRLRRRCAIKVLHAPLTEDRAQVERFLREAQTIAQLEHENIIDIHAYGEEPSGLVFFAMELLSGEDLDARVKARAQRPFSAHEACVWALQAARAVAAVHEAGLIHRDLKTSNLFLARRRDGDEVVKLLDFGIARPEEGSELTKTGLSLGTPAYMAPEQVRDGQVDRRSDIYSFGVLLFKLLARRVPFTGEPLQVAMQHCEKPPPAPSTLAPDAGISPALDAIVLKCMAKRPVDRYASMREVEQALVEVLQNEAPELAPSSRTPRAAGSSLTLTGPVSVVTSRSAIAPLSDPTPSTPSTARTGTTTAMASPRGRTLRNTLLASTAVMTSLAVVVALRLLARDEPPRVGTDEPAPAPAVALELMPASVAAAAQALPKLEPPPAAIERADEPEVGPTAEPLWPPMPAPSETEEAPPVNPGKTSPPRKLKPAAAPAGPQKQLERGAQGCRRKHDALGGPPITIDYAVGIDGKVTRSIPSQSDDLGRCLAAAVAATEFEPKLMLGRKITL